jgi:cytochrome c556
MILSRFYRYTTIIAALLIVTTGIVIAHDGATGIIKERMDAMKDISTQIKLMKKMIRGKQPYNASEFNNAAAIVAKHSRDVTQQFPKDSTEKPSRAKPVIWKDWDEFKELAQKLTDASIGITALAGKSTKPEALRRTFGKLTKTCKACHKKFRFKK